MTNKHTTGLINTAKWFYDLKSFDWREMLQGSVITSKNADKNTVVNKIIFKHFGRSIPVIGWDVKGIQLGKEVMV